MTMADNEHVADLQRYPVLTSETSPLATRRPGAPGAPLGQTVEQALYETLGWRPRIGDPRGFVAALSQSFASKEEQGRILWEWMPHTYAVQADLGAVTGAQASIYKQATVVRSESLPLLEGLEPLRSDYDEEDTDASRAIVKSSISELVGELGQVGGPRVQRVDTLFSILLDVGPNADTPDEPEQVDGQLGNLRERFGLERERVNTIEEEQNLTNYLVLVDYVLSLRRTWLAQRHFFDRQGTDVYLGTQLVLISRALASLVESVYEARDAMDSVFLGEAERQTIELSLEGETTPLTVAELLAWTEHFGSDEGPQLIREGGKEGVRAIRPTIDRLRGLLRAAWEMAQSPEAHNPVRGFHTPRVQRTFEELTTHADRIYDLASQIADTPLITSIEPDHGGRGTTRKVTIFGSNFSPDVGTSDIDFGDGINIECFIESPAEKKLVVEIKIECNAPIGFRDVTVTNPDPGMQSYTKLRAFEVIKRAKHRPVAALAAEPPQDVADKALAAELPQDAADEARAAAAEARAAAAEARAAAEDAMQRAEEAAKRAIAAAGAATAAARKVAPEGSPATEGDIEPSPEEK
jgi:hypothetical protein